MVLEGPGALLGRLLDVLVDFVAHPNVINQQALLVDDVWVCSGVVLGMPFGSLWVILEGLGALLGRLLEVLGDFVAHSNVINP